MGQKERYRSYCGSEPSIPLFSRDWWLDAAAGADNWAVALVEDDGRLMASMPYVVKKKYGFTLLSQAPLTRSIGPWLRAGAGKIVTRLAHEKELMEQLIAQLPDFDYFSQNWSCENTNWLPFHWAGFRQTTRYTYVLPALDDLDAVWQGFRENIRRDCRKAERRFGLSVRQDLGLEPFIRLNRMTFARQGLPVPYPDELLRSLDRACDEHQARRIFIAEDAEGNHHAGIYLVWDEGCAFYLMGGGDPDLRSSGATSLCMWHAIQFAATVTRRFDFEGSMIESIERFFRSFGAEQRPYFSITKSTSPLFSMYLALKGGFG